VVLLSSEEPRLDPVRHGAIAAFISKPYSVERLLDLAAEYGDACSPEGPRTPTSD